MNRYINKIAAGDVHTVWIKPDGTVGACGGNKKKQCDVAGWRNIISVACGKNHTVGLKSDGTVVACGSNFWDECKVTDWRNIVAIACGWSSTVGIERNGTVHFTGYGLTPADVSALNGSTHISLGDGFAVAVKPGGAKAYGSSLGTRTTGVDKWTDIVYVASGLDHTLAVRNDGHVFGVGYDLYNELTVSGWSNVTRVACGRRHSIGLTNVRTVLACGSNKEGQLNVGTWSDIIEVACGSFHTVARRADGSLVATGLNKDGQCNLAGARSVPNADPSQSPIFRKPAPAPTPAAPTGKTVQDDVADQLRRLQEERERLEAERLRVAEETERLQALERERLERERIEAAERERAERERLEAEERERAERERLEAQAQEQRRREELLAAREQEKVEILPDAVEEEPVSEEQAELDLLRSFAGVSVSKKTAKKEELPDFQYVKDRFDEIVLTKYVGTDAVVKIPRSIGDDPITTIGTGCFYMNRTVRTVDMSEASIEVIEKDAFFCCRSLDTVVTSTELFRIGDAAFEGCESLTFIGESDAYKEFLSRGAHLTLCHLGDRVFKDCKSLPMLDIKMVRDMDSSSDHVELGAEAFSGCIRLESAAVSVGTMFTKSLGIAPGVFLGCRALKKLTLPSETRADFVSEDFLDGCRSLVTVEVGAKSDVIKVLKRMGLAKKVTKIKS